MKLVECVPNFSEGRDPAVIRQITDAIEAVRGVQLLDVDPGESTNRTVVTFIGEPEPVQEAAFRAARKAAELIDMTRHSGEHARFGALDVCPFIPVANVTMDECAEMARAVGQRIGEELGIPVYLYEKAAASAQRRNLADVRAGQYEGLRKKLARPEWEPDFGPAEFNAKSGATAVGAREFLIAYNINLNTTDRRYANEIAYEIRERGRWKRVGNTEPFYYKGEVVFFEDGVFPDGNSDFVAASFDELATFYRETRGGDLGERYRSIGESGGAGPGSAAPFSLLQRPAEPLMLLAEESGGEVLTNLKKTVPALERLGQRLRLTYQADRPADGRRGLPGGREGKWNVGPAYPLESGSRTSLSRTP